MNVFGFWTVFKPNDASRFLPGCFFFLSVLHLACTESRPEKQKEEIKIAKAVPAVYKNRADKEILNRNDTVFYNDAFYTGYLISLYPTGDTAALQSYFNGVEEGWQQQWYPGGQLSEKRFYINGKKEGLQQGWWPDGKEKFHFTASSDHYGGNFKEWNSTGLLIKDFNYLNGQEEGSQRLWWDNGSVRANYVIKKGKKYGLIGAKLCNNPYDSVYKK